MARKIIISIIIITIFLLVFPVYGETDRAGFYYKLGVRSLADGRNNEAIRLLEKAAKEDPDRKEIWYELGNAYQRAGERGRAIDSYYLALDTDPLYVKALKRLSETYFKQKNYKMALYKSKQAEELDPKDADIHYLTASSLENLGRMKESITPYKKALNLNPSKYGHIGKKIRQLEKKFGKVAASPGKSGLPEVFPMPVASTTTASASPMKSPENMDDNSNLKTRKKFSNRILKTIGIILAILLLAILIGIAFYIIREKNRRKKIIDTMSRRHDDIKQQPSVKTAEVVPDSPILPEKKSPVGQEAEKKDEPPVKTAEVVPDSPILPEKKSPVEQEAERKDEPPVKTAEVVPDSPILPEKKSPGGQEAEKKDEPPDKMDDSSFEGQYYEGVIESERKKRDIDSTPEKDDQKDIWESVKQDKEKTAVIWKKTPVFPGEGLIQISGKSKVKATGKRKVKKAKILQCQCGEPIKKDSLICLKCGRSIDDGKSDSSPAIGKKKKIRRSALGSITLKPIVCECGRIIRDSSLICPRCGRRHD